MIRVYSANFTKEDYENLSKILSNGLRTYVAPLSYCQKQRSCHTCEYTRICGAVLKAVDFCDKKAVEMVES